MLSCSDVHDQLAAAETGEPMAGDVHDHLASCDACRAEAARVRADLETLRGELASLAPSPFLEDAVLDAARGRSAARRRPSIWLPAGIGIAAAAVLVVLVFFAKLPGENGVPAGGEPFGDDPKGPSLIAFPPTPAQAAARRKERFAEIDGSFKRLHYTMVGAPPPGMVVIGKRLLGLLAKAEGEDAKLVFDRATMNGRNVELDITLGAPGWKGAACRVRARMVLEYDGHLIVEDTLARALGLHEHERPNGVTVGGDTSLAGEVARAQVRIGEHDIETDVEVLREGMPLPAHPLTSGGLPQAQRIVLHGARPHSGSVGDDIDIHHAHGTSFVVATQVVGLGAGDDPRREVALPVVQQGAVQAALQYNAGEHPECLVFLPSLDVGNGGTLAWAFRVERLNLKAMFEPGAMVTIARVWRGRTAIPSRESVAHTWADAKGRVSFVHVRGERGPLRAREVRKDGTITWHEIAAPTSKLRRVIGLQENGTVACVGKEFPLFRPLGTDEHQPDPAAQTALLNHLAQLADVRRDERGNSLVAAVLLATPRTPWKRIEQLMLLCAAPKTRMWQLELGFLSDSVTTPYQLPIDPGIGAIRMKTANVDLRLVWKSGRLHWESSQHGAFAARSGSTDDAGLRDLLRMLSSLRKLTDGQLLQATLQPVGAVRRPLPYGTMRKLIAVLQGSAIDRLLIANTPPRKRR